MLRKPRTNTVYSSDDDNFVPYNKRPPAEARSLPPAQQTAEIRREKKGRGGKTVTAIYNLQLSTADKKELCTLLKKACGCGGAAKEDCIEIQGDQRETIAAELGKLGYKVKFTGG